MSIILKTGRIKELRADLEPRAQQLVNKAAFDIEAGAKDRAPVATGFLKNSISVETGHLKDIVRVGAEYGVYVEFGTGRAGASSPIKRPEGITYTMKWAGMRAHPFLIPALEAVKPKFLAAWKELVKQ